MRLISVSLGFAGVAILLYNGWLIARWHEIGIFTQATAIITTVIWAGLFIKAYGEQE